MLKRLRPKLSYSNVVSTLCLFLLLGGGAYAAAKLPKNSVGSPQIKKNAVKASETAKSSVASPEVKNGSLLCADFKVGEGLCGGRVTVRSNTSFLPVGSCGPNGSGGTSCSYARTAVTAICNAGERAVGGGYQGVSEGTFNPPYRRSLADEVNRPEPQSGAPTGWTVVAEGSVATINSAEPTAPTFTVYVVCAS
jgi:hypothetical protein